ncbi:MAG: magnesium transporter [Verrucomicrobiota bacterium]
MGKSKRQSRPPERSIRSQQRYVEATLETGTDTELDDLFRDVHPADLAEALEELEEDRWEEVLAHMPAEVFGYLIEHIPSGDVLEHLERSSQDFRQEALSLLPDDELVDLLQDLPEDQVDSYVNLLTEPQKETSRRLMVFPETSAGGRMTTEVATVREALTIREAIAELSEVKETSELLARIYVVDERDRLLGKVRLRDLTFNSRDTLIRDVMDEDLLSVDGFADQEEAARMIAKYDLMAIPVINADREFLGVVTYDNALEILEEEASEDMKKISGINSSEDDDSYLRATVFAHLRRRSSWVVTMAFLGIAAGFALYQFEGFLSLFPILALYLTTVVASGGNTGSQAATMVIRAMSLDEFRPRDFWEVIWKEARIGVLLGSLVGICIFAQITFLPFVGLPEGVQAWEVGITVGVALLCQITCSTLFGAALPLIAQLIRLDPAAVAAPVITTFVDVTGILIYFLLAKAILGV